MGPTLRHRPSLPGARPEGASGESEAARQVREMFSRIAPRYDFLNHFLSFNFDRLWRRRTARRFRHILARPDARVLDLCCGTGDLSLALGRAGAANVFGADFAHAMLILARKKSSSESGKSAKGRPAALFLEADSLILPLVDAGCDLVTNAFGFRNLSNYERGLREMLRVLRPGGELAILEFTEPQAVFFGALYRFYFARILPLLGGAISGSAAAYSYLPGSVEKFPLPDELAELLLRAGFADVRFERWTGGCVALHTARRP